MGASGLASTGQQPTGEVSGGSSRALRVAVVVSHVIQYYAPWFREIARIPGIHLRVFFCRRWGVEKYFDAGFGAEVRWDAPLLDGYEYEFLPVQGDANARGFWNVDCPAIGQALERFVPDLVQVFGYGIRANWRAARWAKRRGKPMILFSDSNVSAPRAAWKRAAKQIFVRQFYRYVDGAFCVGDNNRNYHRQYGVPEERLFDGGFPIEVERLRRAAGDPEAARSEIRARYGIADDAFVVNVSAKYIALKRQIDVLAAVHALAQQGNAPWALLVGDGPDRPVLEEFCRINGVRNAVLTGFINQSEIGRYYAASDVVMLASSSEAYGIAVAEGMAFGLPAIVSDRCGCIGRNDIARPGTSALVYPCGDCDAAGAALRHLLEDRALYERMSAEAARIVESRDVAVVARRFAEAARILHALGRR